jgi:hypothetical protein
MLNRSAVIMRPKKPFCDWLRAVDYDDAPEVTLDQMGPTLYLVPDYEDPADADKVCSKTLAPIPARLRMSSRPSRTSQSTSLPC